MAMLFDAIIPILWLGLAGVIFIAIMMTLSILTKPKGEKTPLKLQSYECGEEPVTDRLGFQFNYQYFIYAIVFTGLDVMSIFLYAWAINSQRFSSTSLILMGVFVALLMLTFLYIAIRTRKWRKNVL